MKNSFIHSLMRKRNLRLAAFIFLCTSALSTATLRVSAATPLFFSAQNPWWPPLPFNPHPELPIMQIGDDRFVYDDTSLRYDQLIAQSITTSDAADVFNDETLVSASLLGPCEGGSGNPRFSAIMKSPNQPVVLTWCSDPRGLYDVEYQDALGLSPATNWHNAFAGLPSQGNQTVWSDTGRELPQRLSSAEAQVTTRYYRVVLTSTTSNEMPVVTISNLSAGQVLTGVATVRGGASATQGISDCKLYVDGNPVIGAGGAGAYTLSFDTHLFPNGSHRISVVATDAGGYESTEATETSGLASPTYGAANVDLVFSNDLSGVHLRYNGLRPEWGDIQLISGRWATARNWRVDITKANDENVSYRTFAGSGTEISLTWDGRDSNGVILSPQLIAYHIHDTSQGLVPGIPGIPPLIRPYGRLGTMGYMGQGNHPNGGNYPLTNVRLIGGSAAHGPLASPRSISRRLVGQAAFVGYDLLFNLMDDECAPSAIKASYAGGSNYFNAVNLGLFVGHGLSGLDKDWFDLYLNYLPLYNSRSNTMAYVENAVPDLDWGSPHLKWMCLYSCNQLRDERYRQEFHTSYDELKWWGLMAMNTDLHILQGYATEMTVMAAMPDYWVPAMIGGYGSQNQSIIRAWNFVCRRTQPANDSLPNVARSVYWPECYGDYLYGYGQQVDPQRDPSDPSEYLDLLEEDHQATSPEPQ